MLEKDFDQFVRDELEHHPSVVPDDMWQRISGKEEKDRNIFFLWKWYLLTAGLLTLCLLAITLHTLRVPSQPVASGTYHPETLHPGSISPMPPRAAASPNPETPGSPNSEAAEAPNPGPAAPIHSIAPNPILTQAEPPRALHAAAAGTDQATPGSSHPDPTGPDLSATAVQSAEEKSQHPKSDRPVQPLIPPSSHKTPATLPCPDPNKKYVKNQGWYLEGLASPDYPFITQQLSYLDHVDRLLLTYTAGIRLVKVFPSGLSAMIGLQYSRLTMRSHNVDSLPPPFIHLKIIDLPLLVGYETDNPRSRIGIHGGVIFNLRAFGQGYGYLDQYVGNSTGISTYLGLDFIQQWNDRFSVFAEPYYKHQLSNMLRQPNTLKIDVVGLFIGVRYTLKQYGR